MRIQSLKIQNFRCFEQAEFQFSPNFNLLIGANGGGKTSLLNAVAAALMPALGSGVNHEWPSEGNNSVRLALVEVKGRVRYEYCFPARLEASGEVSGNTVSWWLNIKKNGNDIFWEDDFVNSLSTLSKKWDSTLPITAFYTAKRSWKLSDVSPADAMQKQESRLDGYAYWYDAASDLSGFEVWVVAKSLERLERLSYGDVEELSTELDELDLVNKAVAVALPGAKGVRFDVKYRRMVLDWKDGKPSTSFDILSDGQRSLTALVADIARRMCLLNPQLGNNVLTQTPGIVIIDELDIHLHPAWQRRVVSVLKQIFPEVQFFAASHSPQIIGELPAEEIILLRDGQAVGHPEYALGLDSAEVLEELMGSSARNKEVTEQLHAIRQAIDDDEIAKARELLDALEAKVGGIPEVLESRSAIQSLQWLEGKEE